jgi:hypothetical protein
MKSQSFPRSLILLVSPAGALALSASAFAANSCDALHEAGIKAVQTPHHVYSITTSGRAGKAVPPSEAIFAGVGYLQIHGQWRRSPMPQQDMIEAAQEKLKTHPDTCTVAGDQTVDGLAVTTYKVHNNESGTDSQARILKSNGLLLGQTLILPNGSVVKTRYDYANVQAPEGVK